MRPESVLQWIALSVSLLGAAPVLPYLDPPLALALVFSLALGRLLYQRKIWLPSLPATALTVAGVGFYALGLNLDNPVRPLVHMLSVLLALRQVTEVSSRHFLQIFVLSLVLLAGSSLLTLTAWFLPALVVQVILISLGLILLSFYHRDPNLELSRHDSFRLWRSAAWLPLGALFLMVIFFFILPRTRTPLWNRFNPSEMAQTGYSEQVGAGQSSAVIASAGVVLRAEMAPLGPTDLYWRGTVLDRFDGRFWTRSRDHRGLESVKGGQPVKITLYQHPGEASVLFTLDRPLRTEGWNMSRHHGQVFVPRSNVANRRMMALLESRLNGKLYPTEKTPVDFYLRLPDDISPRLRALSKELSPPEATPRQRFSNLLQFYRQQELQYTTVNLPAGEWPLEQFLFSQKAGHCEFFASSFALLLRLQGIPSRLVGGFYGGEYNELGGYYLVRESMAHVWVEALLPGEGWVRIDPSTLALNAAEVIVDPRTAMPPLTTRLMDTINYLWNKQVITYDLERQIESARNLRKWSQHDLAGWRQGIWIGLPLVGLFLLLRYRPWSLYQRPDPRQRLFRKALRQLGIQEKNLPPGQTLDQLSQAFPDTGLAEFLALYQHVLYREDPLSSERQRELLQRLKRIKKLPTPVEGVGLGKGGRVT